MSEKLIPGMKDDPERRYSYGGHVAHLLTYGTNYQDYPYTQAWCGYAPGWPGSWLGSGSQAEEDLAAKLPLCKRCAKAAEETADFIRGLANEVGYDLAGAAGKETTDG